MPPRGGILGASPVAELKMASASPKAVALSPAQSTQGEGRTTFHGRVRSRRAGLSSSRAGSLARSSPTSAQGRHRISRTLQVWSRVEGRPRRTPPDHSHITRDSAHGIRLRRAPPGPHPGVRGAWRRLPRRSGGGRRRSPPPSQSSDCPIASIEAADHTVSNESVADKHDAGEWPVVLSEIGVQRRGPTHSDITTTVVSSAMSRRGARSGVKQCYSWFNPLNKFSQRGACWSSFWEWVSHPLMPPPEVPW